MFTAMVNNEYLPAVLHMEEYSDRPGKQGRHAVVEINPDDSGVILLEDLERRRDSSVNPVERARLSIEHGLASQFLAGDFAQARLDFIAASFENETRKTALDRLARLHAAQENWEMLISVNRVMAEEATDDQEWISCKLNIGHLLDQRLSRLEEALTVYEEVLDRDPRNNEALLRTAVIMETLGDSRSDHYRELFRLSSTPPPPDATSH